MPERRWLLANTPGLGLAAALAVPVAIAGVTLLHLDRGSALAAAGGVLGVVWGVGQRRREPEHPSTAVDRVPATVGGEESRLADVAPVALQHLETVMTQLEAAGSTIVTGVSDLAGQSQDQVAELAGLVESSQQACDGFAATVLASSREVDRVVAAAQARLDDSLKAIDVLVGRMNASTETQSRLGGVAANLQEQTKAIRDIAATVGEIARQSSMLALNACIEAARSGHEGRGFAVVAEEFRRLSEDTKNASGRISELIGGVDRGIRETVAAVEQTTRLMADHQQAIAVAGTLLHDVQHAMDHVGPATGMMRDRASAFVGVQADLQASLQAVTERAETNQLAVYGLFEHLQFSDICRQGLLRVHGLLDGRAAAMPPAAPDNHF